MSNWEKQIKGYSIRFDNCLKNLYTWIRWLIHVSCSQWQSSTSIVSYWLVLMIPTQHYGIQIKGVRKPHTEGCIIKSVSCWNTYNLLNVNSSINPNTLWEELGKYNMALVSVALARNSLSSSCQDQHLDTTCLFYFLHQIRFCYVNALDMFERQNENAKI